MICVDSYIYIPDDAMRTNTKANGPILVPFTLTNGDSVVPSTRCERCSNIEDQMCPM